MSSADNNPVMSDSFGASTDAGYQGYGNNKGAFGNNDQANHPEHNDAMGRDTGYDKRGAMGSDDQVAHPEHNDALGRDTHLEGRREDAMEYGEHHAHGKPRMVDRIAGGIEEAAGKVLHSHTLEEHGKELKAGHHHHDTPAQPTAAS